MQYQLKNILPELALKRETNTETNLVKNFLKFFEYNLPTNISSSFSKLFTYNLSPFQQGLRSLRVIFYDILCNYLLNVPIENGNLVSSSPKVKIFPMLCHILQELPQQGIFVSHTVFKSRLKNELIFEMTLGVVR